MRIQTFTNKKGMIYGNDPKRIGCDKSGTLKIGNTVIEVSSEGNSVMPLLFHGGTGDYDATFTTKDGVVFTLERVQVREGRILPPPASAVEIMELHIRADTAEAERDRMQAQIDELSQIFDTNSLNFLIK